MGVRDTKGVLDWTDLATRAWNMKHDHDMINGV